MFNTNKKQFINILQQNKQLKIYYKTIQNAKIIQEEKSSFLITDYYTLQDDAKFKLNTLQKKIKHTYLASLFEGVNQDIVASNSVDTFDYNSINIVNNRSIIIPRNEIIATRRYFKSTGIDFILSPYTIITNYIANNAKSNLFVLLIYNNIIYAIIYNEKKQLSYSKIKALTSFESTQDITFLEDDILGQKLYEEVNFLEIQQFLKEIIEDYYAKNQNVEFLEHIEILYALKPLSDIQVTSLEKILMIPIQYTQISLNDSMDDITQAKNANLQNHITPRVKHNSKSIYLWVILLLVVFALGVSALNYQPNNHASMNNLNKKILPKENIGSIEVEMVSLPNHSDKNKIILEHMRMLFNVVPYDSILQDIEINEDSSIFIINFIASSLSIYGMQNNLRDIYADSEILRESKNNFIINTIIQNNQLISKFNVHKKNKKIKNKKSDFLSQLEVSEYLENLILQDSVIQLDSEDINKYSTYYFSISSTIKSPKKFYNLIDKINAQAYSIELSYPITFVKINNLIEVKYKLKFNLENKK